MKQPSDERMGRRRYYATAELNSNFAAARLGGKLPQPTAPQKGQRGPRR